MQCSSEGWNQDVVSLGAKRGRAIDMGQLIPITAGFHPTEGSITVNAIARRMASDRPSVPYRLIWVRPEQRMRPRLEMFGQSDGKSSNELQNYRRATGHK
jgi:hypothetical protein